MANLTDRQKRFVEEYAVDLNAKQAALRAGYSDNYAEKRSWELTHEPKIRENIDEKLDELSKRTGVDAERVIRELGRVAFVSAADVIGLGGAAGATAAGDEAVVASVKVRVTPEGGIEFSEIELRLADKLKALELLGKYLGVFRENGNLRRLPRVQVVYDMPGNKD